MKSTAIGGQYFRVAEADWSNPLDPLYSMQDNGQRWNPPNVPCLYLNQDEATARANVMKLYDGLPYGPEDFDPATAPLLVGVQIPDGRAADAYTDDGLAALGLPTSYPYDGNGDIVPHDVCQPIGQFVFGEGFDGVDCRSAAPGGVRELAWFPRDTQPTQISRRPFQQWW